jgi:hypothetical protein
MATNEHPPVRKNAVIDCKRADDGILTFHVRGAGDFTFDPMSASTKCRARAVIHGFIQRISDAAAAGKSPAEKFTKMKTIADHYASGSDEWNVKATPRGPKAPDANILRAMAEVLGSDVETVLTRVSAAAEKQGVSIHDYLDAAAVKPKVAEVLNRIRAEATGLENDDLLDEIEGAGAEEGAEEEEAAAEE